MNTLAAGVLPAISDRAPNAGVIAATRGKGDIRMRGPTVDRPKKGRRRILIIAMIAAASVHADPVPVRFVEGVSRAFLTFESLAGQRLADGENTQTVRGDRVTARLVFQFLDGSYYENTTVFSERGAFRLLRDHSVQRGPAFKQAMDVTIDGMTGDVTVRYNEDGKSKTASAHLDLPSDVSNGFLLTAMKDLPSAFAGGSLSYVAAGPKPRLVKIEIRKADSPEPFWIGNLRREAIHYVLKVDLKGFAGAVAPLIGKQPPDTHVWVATGAPPVIVKSEGPLTGDGPVGRIVPTGTRPSFQNPAVKSRKKAPAR
jgi:hypothetical protein